MTDEGKVVLCGAPWSLEESLREIAELSSTTSSSKRCQSISLNLFDVDTALAAKLINVFHNPHLSIQTLEFKDCSGHIGFVVAAALTMITLESLTIYFENNVLASSIDAIAHSIGVGLQTRNSRLRILKLVPHFRYPFALSIAAAISLEEGMRGNNTLQELYVDRCRFLGRDVVEALARGMQFLGTLQKVSLTRCLDSSERPLDDDSVAQLIHGIQHNRHLQHLDLYQNKCLDRSIAAIATLLDRTSIQYLMLSWQRINDDESMDLSLLVGALGRTSTLRFLSLSGNKLSSDNDMAFVAAALMHNTSIQTLDLRNNTICNSGLEILSSRVPHMKTLKRLDLLRNKFDDQGLAFLARAMKDNVSITRIKFGIDYHFSSSRCTEYYCTLNRCGRKFVNTFPSIKPSLWPSILERANKTLSSFGLSCEENHADALYFLLQRGSAFLQSSESEHPSRRRANEKSKPKKRFKFANTARHRLLSILHDAGKLQEQRHFLPCDFRSLPLVPNERCGRWYLNEFPAACYFKSTDGHVNVWELSLKRLNLPLLHHIISKKGGCIIVDSSVRKPLPDSFSRTIPIWAAVLNRVVQRYADELGISSTTYDSWDTRLHTPKGVVPPEEHEKMASLIKTRVEALYQSRAIVDPEGLVRALTKPLKVIWIDNQGNPFLSNSGTEKNTSNCFLVVCWNPSRYQYHNELPRKSHVEWIEDPGYYYTPGAADDHESWAHEMTPDMFWEHHKTLLHSSQDDVQVEERIHSIVKEASHASCNITQSGNDCASHEKPLVLPCDQIGSLKLWIGSRRAGRPPYCWDSFDAVLNVTYESYCNEDLRLRDGKFYLQLPVEEGKRDKTELEKWLPVGLAFVFQHLQKDRRVLVHCAQGKDRSVAVVLVFICFACTLTYPLELRSDFSSWDLVTLLDSSDPDTPIPDNEACSSPSYMEAGLSSGLVSRLLIPDGRDVFLSWAHGLMKRDLADGPLFDKDIVRVALHLIRQDREVAEPTRSTMQKINRFLMSSKLYQPSVR